MVDPYDAYPSQFAATFEGQAIGEHGRLLVRHCVPRLIAGTELVEFDRLAERNESVFGKLLQSLYEGRQPRGLPPYQEWLAVFWLIAFLTGFIRLGFETLWARDACTKGISLGIWLSAVLIVAAFLFNRNIFNSDNYRYLIYLLPPWSLGFGLLIYGLCRRGLPARAASGILVVALFWGMTSSTYSWYRDELGFLDRHWRIVRVAQLAWNEIPVSSRLHAWASQAGCIRCGAGCDAYLRRLLGRLSNVVSLGKEDRRHSLSDVSQSVPWLVARAWPRRRQASGDRNSARALR